MLYFTATPERHFVLFWIVCINRGGEAFAPPPLFIILCRLAYSLMLGSSNPYPCFLSMSLR